MHACFKGLMGVTGAGIGSFIGAIPASSFAAVPMKVGSIIGGCLGGTVTVVLLQLTGRELPANALAKACLLTAATAGSYFLGTLVGTNICSLAGFDIPFSTALQVLGWTIASTASFVTMQALAYDIVLGTCHLLTCCKRQNNEANPILLPLAPESPLEIAGADEGNAGSEGYVTMPIN